jgi:hypothetical protein
MTFSFPLGATTGTWHLSPLLLLGERFSRELR